MPDKPHSAKPRLRVEEVPDDAKGEAHPKHSAHDEDDTPASQGTKITSFSRIDSDTKPSEEHTESKPEDETEDKKEEMLESHESDPPIDPIETDESHDEIVSADGEEIAASEDASVSTEESNVSSDEIKEWLQNVRPDTTKEMSKSSGMGKYLAIFLILLILAALGGGVYYYRSNVEDDGSPKQEEKSQTVGSEPTSAPAETATPAPTAAQVDFSKYKVHILNGSGIAGEAGKAQGYLTSAGFKDFKTGNASSFSYADTQVSLKKDTPEEVFTKIKSMLETYYQGVVKSDKALDDKSEFDVEITIGKKKS